MRRIGVLSMAVAMSGCGALLPASAERQGDCTLVLRDGQGVAARDILKVMDHAARGVRWLAGRP